VAVWFVALMLGSASSAIAQSSDVEVCTRPIEGGLRDSERGILISSCNAAIASGRYKGRQLAELLYGRAYGLVFADARQRRQNMPAFFRDLDEASRLAPTWGEPYSLRSGFIDEPAERVRLLGLAIQYRARAWRDHHHYRGVEYMNLGKRDAAIKDFCTFLSLVKNNPNYQPGGTFADTSLRARTEAALQGMQARC
jgi:hypothetical protein